MFNKKIYLKESELKAIVEESARRILEEGWFNDKIQDRKSTKANQDNKIKELEGMLRMSGVSDMKRCTVQGDDGFCFTMPLDKATAIAKELKPKGVRMLTKHQDNHPSDGTVRTGEVFATFGPYFGGVR